MTVTAEDIARVAHEVNRAYCAAIGDAPQPAWKDAPDSQRQSALKGVSFHAYADHTPEQSHESWLEAKAEDGWVYGPEKDENARTHPCILPYADLPQAQRVKDHLFVAVVHSMRARLVDTPEVDPPEPVAQPEPPPVEFMASLNGDDDLYEFTDEELTEVLTRFKNGHYTLQDVDAYLMELEDHIKDQCDADKDAALIEVRANLLDTFASMTQVPIGFNGLIDSEVAHTVMDTPMPEDGLQKLGWFAEAEGRLRYLKAEGMLQARTVGQ